MHRFILIACLVLLLTSCGDKKMFYTGGSSTFSPINENDDYLLAFDTLQIQSSTGKLKI